jgi:hypothetical protein
MSEVPKPINEDYRVMLTGIRDMTKRIVGRLHTPSDRALSECLDFLECYDFDCIENSVKPFEHTEMHLVYEIYSEIAKIRQFLEQREKLAPPDEKGPTASFTRELKPASPPDELPRTAPSRAKRS